MLYHNLLIILNSSFIIARYWHHFAFLIDIHWNIINKTNAILCTLFVSLRWPVLSKVVSRCHLNVFNSFFQLNIYIYSSIFNKSKIKRDSNLLDKHSLQALICQGFKLRKKVNMILFLNSVFSSFGRLADGNWALFIIMYM